MPWRSSHAQIDAASVATRSAATAPFASSKTAVAFIGRKSAIGVVDAVTVEVGSYGPDATEIFQEGFRISPCRIAEGGRLNPLFFELLAANIRVPSKTLADLQAQLASLELGKAEVERLVGRYGTSTFAAAAAALVDQAERRMRR